MNFMYVFSCIGPYCICTVCLFVFLFYCTCTTFVVNKRKHKSNLIKIASLPSASSTVGVGFYLRLSVCLSVPVSTKFS